MNDDKRSHDLKVPAGLARRFSLQSSRVGDCFYYFEEMQRRGMQPSDRIKSSLVSVLARTGDMSAALEASHPC